VAVSSWLRTASSSRTRGAARRLVAARHTRAGHVGPPSLDAQPLDPADDGLSALRNHSAASPVG